MSDKNRNKAEEANHKMDELFKDYSERALAPARSEAEMANQQLQKDFYKDNDENSPSFVIDSNSPPIEK